MFWYSFVMICSPVYLFSDRFFRQAANHILHKRIKPRYILFEALFFQRKRYSGVYTYISVVWSCLDVCALLRDSVLCWVCVVMDSLHILCFVVRTQFDGMDFFVKNKPFHRVVLLIVCILLVYVFER